MKSTNWHYSQALEAAYLAANSSDGEPSVPSNGQNPNGKTSWTDKTTDASNPSQSGTMCKPSMANRGLDWWMSSLAASRAKTSAPPEMEQGLMEKSQGCGNTWRESYLKYDLLTHSWKTHQLSLFGGLESSSETWPKWGIMLHGECFPLPMLEHDTSVKESGSWPTPLAGCSSTESFGRPTPIAVADSKCGKNLRYRCWEHLMGWPIGWTAKDALGTDKFRLWLLSRGKYCQGWQTPETVAEGSNIGFIDDFAE